jgi:predicted enzyme related to lactoylglutathione lyase
MRAMPTIHQHPAGNFAWMELATTDQPAAKHFYSSLFGWDANDFPMGPDSFYTMFALNGQQTGAAFTLSAAERETGIPPHWQLYIAVDDADAAARRSEELGGKTVHAAFDVMTFGRMAVFEDPTGAYFSVWQPRDHKGMGIYGENGALCWADLQTRDRDRAIGYYGGLFGWQFMPGKDKDADGYLHIKNGEQFIGGLPEPRTMPPDVPPHWLAYIHSPDCDAQTAKAAELGARVIVPPMLIEGQFKFSVLADPQGAVFALFTPAR